MTPSVGVAIPSFKQGEYAFAAIRSLQGLSIPFQAIVQDGGSDDDTIATIVRAVGSDPRFRVVVEADSGQSDAINRAWGQLIDHHQYLTWLNTDDIVHPAGLERLVAFLEETPSASLAYGDLDVIDELGRPVAWLRSPNRVRRYRLVYHHNLVPGICPVIRSAALRQTGLLDPRLHFMMDHDLFVRLAEQGDLRRVPVEVAWYREHDQAKTRAGRQRMDDEARQVRERYRALPRPAAEVVRTVLRAAWWPTRRIYRRGPRVEALPEQPTT